MISAMKTCECGCGGIPKVATENNRQYGWIKGQQRRFVHGHNGKGKLNGHWKGGSRVTNLGYRMVYIPGHHRAGSNGYVFEHIVVMEKVLGRALQLGEVVHHINEDQLDNRPENLMVFESNTAHMKHHQELKALQECGHKDWRKCSYCHQYDDPIRMASHGSSKYHRECRNVRRRIKYAMRRN